MFRYRLALALGCFVADIDDMGAAEYEGWIRYANTEPFGFPRDETRYAVLAANMLAASSNKWMNTRVTDPNYWRYTPPTPITVEGSLRQMQAMIAPARKRRRIGYGH